jgi:RHS repeat-associated protein
MSHSDQKPSRLAVVLFLLVTATALIPTGTIVISAFARITGGPLPSVLLIAPDPVSDSVAATQGDFRVDESGAATYGIPLYAVPGTAGMTPKLSLDYSTRNGYGPLGKGWIIGGLSAITRCRMTREAGDFNVNGAPVDGNTGPINYSASDRYCLDGARLIPAQSGSGECAAVSGMSALNLRTEVETFQRVCGYTANGSTRGIAFFTVERRDGTISWYGDRDNNSTSNRTDGYFNSTRPGYEGFALSWAMTRTQDSSGNYIDYIYLKNQSGAVGEQLISEVRFSGKTVLAGQAGTALAPYAKLSFQYSARPTAHQSRNYAYGGQLSQVHRLDSIVSCASGDAGSCATTAQARVYRLTYAASASGSGFDTLTAIQECRDTVGSACAAPTTFDWSQATNGFVTSAAWNTGVFPSTKSLRGLKFGDVDGDGRPDMVWMQAGGSGQCANTAYVYVAFGDIDSNGRQTFTPANQYVTCTPAQVPNNRWEVFDYNADGRADLLLPGPNSNWAIYPSLGRPNQSYTFDFSQNLIASLVPAIPVSPPIQYGSGPPQLIDINGDAQLDALYQTNNSVLKVRLMLPNAGGWGAELAVNIADFQQFEPCPEINTATNCLLFKQYVIPTNNQLRYSLLDLEGDGRSDLKLGILFGITADPQCNYCMDVGRNYLYRVTEISATQVMVRRYDGLIGTDTRLGDVNGDGLTDKLIRSSGTNPTWSLSLNTGIGFTAPTSIGGIPNDSPTDGLVKWEDVNRDGRADLLYVVSESSRKVFRVRYGRPDGTIGPESILNGNNAEACAGSGCDPKLKAHMFADLDADGNLDFFAIKLDDNPDFFLSQPTARGVPRDVIMKITDGYGARIELRYAPLTNAGVYRRDSNSRTLTYGRGSIVNDLFDGSYYVVAQVSSSAPTLSAPDALASAYYRYAGAKIQGGGRGYLGFREISVFDTTRPGGYLVTTSNYRQDFPYAGRPNRTVVRAFAGQSFAPPNCLTSFPSFACYVVPGQGFGDLGGVVVSDSTQLWESDTDFSGAATIAFSPGTQAPVQVRSIGAEESVRDLATGLQTKKTLTAMTYGSFGNVVQSVVDTYTGTSTVSMQTVITSNGFINDAARWRLGLMNASMVTYKRPGTADIVRTMGYAHDLSGPATGLLTEVRKQAGGDASQALTTVYKRDEFGNRVQATTCAAPATNCSTTGFVFQPADPLAIKRYSRVEYDAQGRFPITAYEPFSATVSAGYEEKPTTRNLARDPLGNVIQHLDIDGVQSILSFGRLGRPHYRFTRTTPVWDRMVGVTTLTTYRWCGTGSGQVSCPVGARFREQVTQTAQPRQWAYFDALGRTIMRASETLNIGVPGADVSAACADYDTTGNIVRRSVPFFLAAVAGPDGPSDIGGICAAPQRQWMVTTFDVLLRPLRVLSPDTTDILLTHSGLNTTSSDPRRNATTQSRNGLDEIVSVTDALGTVTSYAYTADGQISAVSRNGGSGTITNSYEYDVLGRNVRQSDPDVGVTLLQHNALDELVVQTDNAGQRTELLFDARGRAFSKTVRLPDGSVESKTNRTFDTAPNGAGKLAAESIVDVNADWVVQGQVATLTQLSYDQVGRPSNSTTFIGDQIFGTVQLYDDLGRLWKSLDASGHWTKTEFNTRGHAVATCANDWSDPSPTCPANPDTYQRTLATDAWGHVLRERRANNPSLEVTQTYQSDNGRLQRICAGDAACQLVNEAYAWDAAGNLSSRQKEARYLEVFAYDGLNRLTEAKLAIRNGATVNEVTLAQSFDALGNVCSKNGTAYTYSGADGCPMQVSQATIAQSSVAEERGVDALWRPARRESVRDDGFAVSLFSSTRYRPGFPTAKATNTTFANKGAVVTSVGVPAARDDGVRTYRFDKRQQRHPARNSQRNARQLGARNTGAGAVVAAAPLTTFLSPHAVATVGAGSSVTLYSYDAAGRQIRRDAPGTVNDRIISYTADGNAREILMGSGQRIRYWYGPDGQRYRKQEGGRTTLYIGNVEIQTEAGITTFRRYIAGVAVQTIVSGVAATRYLFHDHLGSVVRIANSDGTVAEGLDYAADGLRRSLIDPRSGGLPSTVLPRGFTGHEMLDGTDLIHMNGRVYDPQLGRFLQADPFIQTPTRLQSWNPYSYVDNNPLRYNDPSGYLIGTLAAAAVTVTLPTVVVTGSAISATTIAAVSTAAAATVAVTATSASGVTGAYSNCPTSNAAGDNSTSASSSQSSGPSPMPNELPPGAVSWIDPMGNGEGVVLMADGETALAINIVGGSETVPIAAGCTDQLASAGIANVAAESGIAQLQTALDLAGFLPVVGTAADLVNAGIYAYRGEYALAAMSTVGAVPLVGDALAAGAKGARALHAANTVGRTNAELVQEVATRAEAWGARQGLPAAGSGPVQGTLKHGYAKQLLDRYQSMYGDRGLKTEVSFKNGQRVSYGTKGSVRLDVHEPSTGTVWDYKFTQNPSISSSRVQSIKNHVPGTTTVNAVGP